MENNYEANIIEADKVAKEVMLPGNDVYNEIVKTFPEVIADNKIDSKKLAEIVFNDKEQLEKLKHQPTLELLRKLSQELSHPKTEL